MLLDGIVIPHVHVDLCKTNEKMRRERRERGERGGRGGREEREEGERRERRERERGERREKEWKSKIPGASVRSSGNSQAISTISYQRGAND
jgi:hypothetical protein